MSDVPAQLATELLHCFGSLPAVLAADVHTLASIGGNAAAASHIALIHEAMAHAARAPILERPLIGDLAAVIDYFHALIGNAQEERLAVLFLDVKNRLIHEMGVPGTIDQTPLPIRNVVKRGLAIGAASMIVAHNHPSGDSSPSRSDRETTRLLSSAGHSVDLRLLDHIVVARGEHFSFRAAGLL